MKNEIRGFVFLAFAAACFFVHEICDSLFWIGAYMTGSWPGEGS